MVFTKEWYKMNEHPKGMLGKKHPNPFFKKGHIAWNKGKEMTKEIRDKMSISHIGKKRSKEVIDKIRLKRLGEKHTESTKKKISESHKGENNPSWKGGISSINGLIKSSRIYENWRRSVFERDKFTCQECSKIGGGLEAHHIKPFAEFIELRFDVDNGRTLCEECHKEMRK